MEKDLVECQANAACIVSLKDRKLSYHGTYLIIDSGIAVALLGRLRSYQQILLDIETQPQPKSADKCCEEEVCCSGECDPDDCDPDCKAACCDDKEPKTKDAEPVRLEDIFEP